MEKLPLGMLLTKLLQMVSSTLMLRSSFKMRFHVVLITETFLGLSLDGALKSFPCLRKLFTQVLATDLSLS